MNIEEITALCEGKTVNELLTMSDDKKNKDIRSCKFYPKTGDAVQGAHINNVFVAFGKDHKMTIKRLKDELDDWVITNINNKLYFVVKEDGADARLL